MTPDALMSVRQLSAAYGRQLACREISFELFPGEVICLVGESGSGKSTLLNTLAHRHRPASGEVIYRHARLGPVSLGALDEARLRELWRTDWGFVRQNPRDGLRMRISAGGNIGERLMALGERHYGRLRETAVEWLRLVEIDPQRIDDRPDTFSGGMQQRLQIARNLVTRPRLVFMDEPTSGLDVSVQARFLDLLRRLVAEMGLSVVLVTHDLGVARLLGHRILVMKEGQIVEQGLTDQVLDDPQHPYTQLLVTSVLAA